MNNGVDIIVVNYRTADDLQQFLDSYAEHVAGAGYFLQIVNVAPDDESKRVTYTFLAQLPEEHIAVINTYENVGYGAAVNLAARQGFNPYLAIFNADVVLTQDAIEACVNSMQESDAHILGPRQVDERGRVTHAGITGTNTDPKMRGWLSYSNDEYRDVIECVSVSGSAYFITREAWDALANCDLFEPADGAFLETPLYYEETWCSYHARAHGMKIVYDGRIEIIHKWHRSIIKSGENEAAQKMKIARSQFRMLCDVHGIEHD